MTTIETDNSKSVKTTHELVITGKGEQSRLTKSLFQRGTSKLAAEQARFQQDTQAKNTNTMIISKNNTAESNATTTHETPNEVEARAGKRLRPEKTTKALRKQREQLRSRRRSKEITQTRTRLRAETNRNTPGNVLVDDTGCHRGRYRS